MNTKGQNIIEYLLLIAVLALGFVVGGKYLRNIIKNRANPNEYEAKINWNKNYEPNDRKRVILYYTNTGSVGIPAEAKNSW